MRIRTSRWSFALSCWQKLYLREAPSAKEQPRTTKDPRPTTVFIIGNAALAVKPRTRTQFATITFSFNSLGEFFVSQPGTPVSPACPRLHKPHLLASTVE